MVRIPSLIFRIILLSALFFASGALVSSQTVESESRKAEIMIEVDLDDESFVPGQKIKGEIRLQNTELYSVVGLKTSYVLYLLPEGVDRNLFTSGDLKAFDIVLSSDEFSLRGRQSKVIPLKYSIPEYLPTGEYRLKVGLIREGVTDESSLLVKLGGISGQSDYVDIRSTFMLREGKEYPGLVGVSYEPVETKVCRILVVNNTSEAVTLSPNTVSYLRFIGGDIVDENVAEPFSLVPQEIKNVEVLMPSISAPQSYITTIQFKSEEGALSPITACRWLIRGESASIIRFDFDKNTYLQGETANVHIVATGPVDSTAAESDHHSTDLSSATLKVAITDAGSGRLIGEAEREVSLSSILELNLPIAITSDSDHYRATLILMAPDGKIIASQEIENEPPANPLSKLIYALIALILFVLLYVGYQRFNRNKGMPANNTYAQ